MGIIESQLDRVKIADLTDYDSKKRVYNIKKYKKPAIELEKCYIIKINHELVNNDTSIVATNWNAGTSPKYAYLRAYINKFFGNMVRVDSIAVDNVTYGDINSMWSGWLPVKDITIVKEI